VPVELFGGGAVTVTKMSATASLGLRQIGAFLLYFIFVAFTLGFVSVLLSGWMRDVLQTMIGPCAAIISAYAIGRTQALAGLTAPARKARAVFSVTASAAMMAVLITSLVTVVLSTGDGFTGLPLGGLMFGFLIVFFISTVAAFFGLTAGFRLPTEPAQTGS